MAQATGGSKAAALVAMVMLVALAHVSVLVTEAAPAAAASGKEPYESVPANWRPVADSWAAEDDACADVMFVGVRGSGESYGSHDGMGRMVQQARSGVAEALGTDVTVRQYRLDYPAYRIEGLDDISSLLGGLKLAMDNLLYFPDKPLTQPLYFQSIDEGALRLAAVMADSTTRCPNEQIVLSGYSSGAMVVHKALSYRPDDPVGAVVLIADPAREPGSAASAGLFGSAFGGAGAVTLVNALTGFADVVDELQVRADPIPARHRAKVFEVCDQGDIVCAPLAITNLDDYVAQVVDQSHARYGTPESGVDADVLHQVGVRAGRLIAGPESHGPSGGELIDDVTGSFDTGYWYTEPGQVSTTPSGDLIFIGWDGTPRRYSLDGGHPDYPFEFVPWRTGLDGTDTLYGITTDQFGNIYASVRNVPQGKLVGEGLPYVTIHRPSGELVARFSLQHLIGHDSPGMIKVDSRGRILISAPWSVNVLSQSGALIETISMPGTGAFALDSQDRMFALHSYSLGRPDPALYRRNADGSWETVPVNLPRGAYTLDADDHGHVYVSGNYYSTGVWRIDADTGAASVVEIPESQYPAGSPSGVSRIKPVAVTPQGQVWVVYKVARDQSGWWNFQRLEFGTPRAYDQVGTPVVVGDPTPQNVLEAHPGTWSPAPTSLTYEWRRDGLAIPGAIEPTYQVSSDDVGHAISVAVTGTRLGRLTASQLSDPVIINEKPPATAPGTVGRPDAVAGDGSATITWTAPPANGSLVTGYTVTGSPGGATKSVDGADTLAATIDGLTNGVAYTFTVVATNAVGTSTPSTPSEPVTPVGSPGTVARPNAIPGDRTATITWTPAAANGSAVTGYTVTASPGGATKTVTKALTATIGGLTNGTAYTFTVVATNAAGSSAPSASTKAVTPAGRPGRPPKPRAKVARGKVTITWKAPLSNGAPLTRFVVDISRGTDQRRPASARTATFARLRPGRYTIRVIALNEVGASTPSVPVTVRVR